MRVQWYKNKDIVTYQQIICCDTKSGTQRLLNKFYLEIDSNGITTICFKSAIRVTSLLTFKGERIIYKDLDAVINLTPRNQLIFTEVIKKHLTAIVNI